ncbi:MAG: acyl-ACP--UDP-N-acetylglucosamine O-acyltransferase [Holophagales bacterium]|jgi:UDP-N-acetylglucosamine acyltransferase|nr:acyl-ACP--UDP-N-acetylglucosamine O-acyltransferase [Holophagales bacterium]
MNANIHPMSVVSSDAEIGENVVIGPFCVVEGNSRIGDGTVLRSHVVVGPNTEIGEDNDIFPHATLGMQCQDIGYKGELTRLIVGSRNIIRESCTFHRGTAKGGGVTKVGDDNFIMTGVHIAHDCMVGSKIIMANCATLAGHVEVGDGANVGGFSGVHQFARIGDHAFMGGFTTASMDVLPYMKTAGTREARSYGVNTIGLRRKGFSEETIKALQRAHRILFGMKLLRDEAMKRVDSELGNIPEVAYLLDFIRKSKRGIIRG